MVKHAPAQTPTVPVADSPHKRPANTDPRVDGPYLDDIHAEQENAYRDYRNMSDEQRTKHDKDSAKSGTVVTRPDTYIQRDVRELTKEELEAVGEYEGTAPQSTTKKKSKNKNRNKAAKKTAASNQRSRVTKRVPAKKA